MDKVLFSLALRNVEGIGEVHYKTLVEHFGSAKDVFCKTPSDVEKVLGVGREILKKIKKKKVGDSEKNELLKAKSLNSLLIPLEDERYPGYLKNIYDPPSLLYVRGDLEIFKLPMIAIVGTRNPTFYGKDIAYNFGKELARAGFVVVSGMARGIDTSAHMGALDGGGKTIAVLGSGLDVVYPPENRKLYERIIKNGAIISEFPFGTRPLSRNFPKRNRIISGLSKGVLVVEAGKKSGSLITVDFALEQGKEVYAVPGRIDSLRSKGTNKLIKEGAKLVETPFDIISELMPKRPYREDMDLKPLLDPLEKEVFELVCAEPIHVDMISKKIGISIQKVLSLISSLEMKGFVKQTPGRFIKRGERSWESL